MKPDALLRLIRRVALKGALTDADVVVESQGGLVFRDNYELFVTTDGCYTATAAVESVGGPTLRAEDGAEVRNLLYAYKAASTSPDTSSPSCPLDIRIVNT